MRHVGGAGGRRRPPAAFSSDQYTAPVNVAALERAPPLQAALTERPASDLTLQRQTLTIGPFGSAVGTVRIRRFGAA